MVAGATSREGMMTDYHALRSRAIAASQHIPGCPGDEECWRYEECTHRDLIAVNPKELVALFADAERLHSVLSGHLGVDRLCVQPQRDPGLRPVPSGCVGRIGFGGR